jgi:WD40-like Beta Propeller Repeat
MFGLSFAVPPKVRSFASRPPSLSILVLIALAACAPVAVPPSATALGPSPSAVLGSPEATGEPVSLIVYSRVTGTEDIHTFIVGTDGSNEAELSDVHDCCAVWSPDGRILVVPDNLASARLLPATIHPDGTGYTVFRIGPTTLNLAPGGWSPDGTRMVFEAWDDTDRTRDGIYVADASSLAEAAPVQITHARLHDIALGWSPDGTRLLLIQVTRCPAGECDGGDLYVVGTDGANLTRLNPEGTFVPCCGPASWSPDGTQVIFGAPSLDASGAPDLTTSAVYVADADGSHVEAITEPGAFTDAAGWSPEGDWIVFNKKSGPIGVKGSDLYLVHPDGSGLHAITTAGAAGRSDQIGAVWSPDGSRLLFTVLPGGPVKRGDLWIVDVDGSNLTPLTDTPAQYWGYAWQPGP